MRPDGDQPPVVDGEFRFDERSRAASADDFGHIVRRTPAAVLLPASPDDVAATIRWAARSGRKLVAQGQRHSVFGRTQVCDGIAVDMTRLHTVHAVRDDRVVVDAGATWRDVLAATLPRGRTAPVLTDYLDLSVGGTLAVGGVGATTSRFGVQSDTVLEMRVVTGRGDVLTCSPRRHADLFDAVRGGQGAVVASPAGCWTYRIEAIKEFSGSPPDDDALLVGLSDDRPRAQLATLPYVDHLDRLAALEQALRVNDLWSLPHPWVTTFVGDRRSRRSSAQNSTGWTRPTWESPAGRAVTDPSGASTHSAAAVAVRPLVLRVQPDPHPGNRRSRHGCPARVGEQSDVRTRPRRRWHPLPGQRHPDVT
jgi:cytokinin dehydrogenase